MEHTSSLWILIVSTSAIALVHTLAPDHWVPFVSIGRAQNWSTGKLVWVTLLSGLGHVGSSIVIGSIGLVFGFSLTGLEAVESQRAEVAGMLLIGFGLAYAVWGLKQVRSHKHHHIDTKRTVTIWTLVAIFVLGPCEPLIPLMFVSATHGWGAVILVTGIFSLITIAMMLLQALLVYKGIGFFKFVNISHHYSHPIAGVVIAVTGIMVMFLGI